MTESVNELMNHGGDCRTAPATQGLLITCPVLVGKKADVGRIPGDKTGKLGEFQEPIFRIDWQKYSLPIW